MVCLRQICKRFALLVEFFGTSRLRTSRSLTAASICTEADQMKTAAVQEASCALDISGRLLLERNPLHSPLKPPSSTFDGYSP